MIRNHTIRQHTTAFWIAAGLLAVLGTVALFVPSIRGETPFALGAVGLIAVGLTGASALSVESLRAARDERGVRALRRTTAAPTTTYGIGTANGALDHPTRLDPAARQGHADLAVYVRFPATNGTGELKLSHKTPATITQQIASGTSVPLALDAHAMENTTISDALRAVRRYIGKQFSTQPTLASAFVGADYNNGTTGIRVLAHHGADIVDADWSIVHLMHSPIEGPAPWEVREDVAAALAEEPNEPDAAPRELTLVSHRKARAGTANAPAPKPVEVREDFLREEMHDRADMIKRGLILASRGAFSLVRAARGVSDHAAVGKKIRELNAVVETVAQRGGEGTSGLEVRRLTREAGAGFFGSFVDTVFEVHNAQALTGLTRSLRSQPLKTMEGFELRPGDRDPSLMSSRRVIVFGYGAKGLVDEIPQAVRLALRIDEREFLFCGAVIPQMEGARFAIFAEASQEELLAAYPGITRHRGWPTFEEACANHNAEQEEGRTGAAADRSSGEPACPEVVS